MDGKFVENVFNKRRWQRTHFTWVHACCVTVSISAFILQAIDSLCWFWRQRHFSTWSIFYSTSNKNHFYHLAYRFSECESKMCCLPQITMHLKSMHVPCQSWRPLYKYMWIAVSIKINAENVKVFVLACCTHPSKFGQKVWFCQASLAKHNNHHELKTKCAHIFYDWNCT